MPAFVLLLITSFPLLSEAIAAMGTPWQPIEPRTWVAKFRDALRGIVVGVRAQRSFAVHLPMAVMVLVAGFALQVSQLEWGLLILAISAVVGAELFNSSLEQLSRAITTDENRHLGDALDSAAGAVLVVSLGAALTGALVLGYRAGVLFAWWGN